MQVVQTLILGLALGGTYALVANGLVAVYRSSGIVNFAQGAFVMVGAFIYYEFKVRIDVPAVPALVLTLGASAGLGVVIHLLILQPMRGASALARVVATLAILVVLQSAAMLLYGSNTYRIPALLPTNSVTVLPDVSVGVDRLIILFVGAALTLILWALYRFTGFGRVTTAVSESERIVASLGHSPDRIAAINWGIGAGLAALAGVLVAPITFLNSSSLPLLVLPALAAGLVGGYMSFPSAFVAALAIGSAEALLSRYVSTPGWATSAPFLAVVVVMVVRGRGLPLRSHITDRLPQVGSGRVRLWPTAAGYAIVVLALALWVPDDWATPVAVTVAGAIICLSIVVITGYAGQLSLAQFVIAGVGALAAAKVMELWGWSFLAAIGAAIVVAVATGLLVGAPSLRTRGINLAIATLGLGVAIYALVLNDPRVAGGTSGIPVDPPTVLGWSIDALEYPGRYAIVCVTVFLLGALAVSNVRRGALGRRLLAVRSSERAATALGINVYGTKLYAFVLGAVIAAVGGVMLAFASAVVVLSPFSSTPSISLVMYTVLGGVGNIGGAVIGATLLDGGVVSRVFQGVESLDGWLPLIAGTYILVVLRFDQSGLYEMNRQLVLMLKRKLTPTRKAPAVAASASGEPGHRDPVASGGFAARHRDEEARTVKPQTLEIERLAVRFGGVHAIKELSLSVRPGEVHGLIGPNGAGKTTAIDAATGFVRASGGSLKLDGTDITTWSARDRSRAGLARSFQSIELFDELTVAENIAIGSDVVGPAEYLIGLARPKKPRLSAAAATAVEAFGLSSELERKPTELPYGRRRMVGMAQIIGRLPSVLLLDEPAAGLGDREASELGEVIRWLADEWGIAVLLVEHNMDVVLAVSDRVTVMASGAEVFSGDPAAVVADEVVRASYLGEATVLDDERATENA